MTLEIVRGFADRDFRSELLERIYEKYRIDPQVRFFILFQTILSSLQKWTF